MRFSSSECRRAFFIGRKPWNYLEKHAGNNTLTFAGMCVRATRTAPPLASPSPESLTRGPPPPPPIRVRHPSRSTSKSALPVYSPPLGLCRLLRPLLRPLQAHNFDIHKSPKIASAFCNTDRSSCVGSLAQLFELLFQQFFVSPFPVSISVSCFYFLSTLIQIFSRPIPSVVQNTSSPIPPPLRLFLPPPPPTLSSFLPSRISLPSNLAPALCPAADCNRPLAYHYPPVLFGHRLSPPFFTQLHIHSTLNFPLPQTKVSQLFLF